MKLLPVRVAVLIVGWKSSERKRRGDEQQEPGTVLVRDYHGQRHTVTVAPDGFNWQGTTYPSLSAIARAITGTAWSGPRFFALARGNGTPPAHGPHKTWARAGRNCPATGIEQGIAAFASLLTGVTPKQ